MATVPYPVSKFLANLKAVSFQELVLATNFSQYLIKLKRFSNLTEYLVVCLIHQRDLASINISSLSPGQESTGL